MFWNFDPGVGDHFLVLRVSGGSCPRGGGPLFGAQGAGQTLLPGWGTIF